MTETPQDRPTDEEQPHRVVVLGPDGVPVGELPERVVAVRAQQEGEDGGDERSITDLVEQPAKVMRIGTMIKQLLDEVKAAPLDEASRVRLKEIHARSIEELEDGLAPELVAELERLSLPFTEDAVPSEAELRIAQAQLVGWLEGLFHGIQTALFAQQMAARAQFEEMRRRAGGGPMVLPPGMHPGMPPGAEGTAGDDGDGRRGASGPYL